MPDQVGKLRECRGAVGPVTVVGTFTGVRLHVPLHIGQLCCAEVAAWVAALEALLTPVCALVPHQIA